MRRKATGVDSVFSPLVLTPQVPSPSIFSLIDKIALLNASIDEVSSKLNSVGSNGSSSVADAMKLKTKA